MHEILSGLPARQTELAEVGLAVNDVRNDGPVCLDLPVDDRRPAGRSGERGRGRGGKGEGEGGGQPAGEASR